jgi:hypothetical protein
VDAGPSSITSPSRWSTHRTSFRERPPLWDGGGKRLTEEVVELDAARAPRAVLGEQLAPVYSWLRHRSAPQSSRKHVDGTGEFEGADGFARHSDRQSTKRGEFESLKHERARRRP